MGNKEAKKVDKETYQLKKIPQPQQTFVDAMANRSKSFYAVYAKSGPHMQVFST